MYGYPEYADRTNEERIRDALELLTAQQAITNGLLMAIAMRLEADADQVHSPHSLSELITQSRETAHAMALAWRRERRRS